MDQATSGALVFATAPEQATEISQLFEHHLVERKYIFLTDRKTDKKEITYHSFIEKDKTEFVSTMSQTPNAKTTFKFLQDMGPYSLWEAVPHTSKPHQIRLHAQDNGIHVLGDKDHGGSDFTSVFASLPDILCR